MRSCARMSASRRLAGASLLAESPGRAGALRGGAPWCELYLLAIPRRERFTASAQSVKIHPPGDVSPRLPVSSSRALTAQGRRSRKVLPRPGSLFSSSAPPCATAAWKGECRQRAAPAVPPCGAAAPGSECPVLPAHAPTAGHSCSAWRQACAVDVRCSPHTPSAHGPPVPPGTSQHLGARHEGSCAALRKGCRLRAPVVKGERAHRGPHRACATSLPPCSSSRA
jgi:hypothetical protein